MAPGGPESGLLAEVWQEADGPLQWAQIRLETNGQTLTWTRNSRADRDWRMVESGSDASLRDWIPTPHGLLHRDQGQWQRLPLGGADEQATVTALVPNLEEGVWAATDGDGLWLVQPHLVRMLTPPKGWGTEEVHSLAYLRDGRLLVGGASNTLARIDPRSLLSPEVSLFGGGTLATHHPDGTVLRIGAPNGSDGVFRVQGSNEWWYGFIAKNRVMQLAQVSQLLTPADGSVWITDEKGVLHIPRLPELPDTVPGMPLEPPAYSVFLNTLPQHVFLYGLTEAPDGGIRVGSAGAGLFRIFQGQVENFPAPDLLPGNPCIPLGFATDGTLWLGSEFGLGVWRDGRYRWLRSAHGLAESVVCDVEEAEGYLWLAGKRGVHGIPRKDLEAFLAGQTNRVSCVSLGRSDGLASTETHLKLQPVMAKTDDGQVWVGTARGVAHFRPREVLDRVRPPPIAIEGLKANGRPVTLGIKRLLLPPDAARAVEIAFNSLSFVAPERVTFQYQLVGPGAEVTTETAQPYAVFPHLRHGRHVFTVQARSGNGLVSDPGARLEFDIEPYFHQTPLFYGALGFAGLASVAGLVFVRVRVNERKITQTHERKITSVRAGIARDVHDRLGAGLVRLAWQNGREDTAAAAESTTPAQEAARELLRSLDEAVWAINPSKDHLEGVVNYLGSWLRSYFAESPPTLSLDLPAQVPDHPVPAEWRHHVLMIVREACANVLKHARATQIEVAVSLDQHPGSLTILIRDNGIGFIPTAAPSSGKTGGNGLHHLQERAVSLNARLDFRSTPGSGTEILLVVPLPPA